MRSKIFKFFFLILLVLCFVIVLFINKSDRDARRLKAHADGCYYLEAHYSVFSFTPAQTIKVYSECGMGQTFVSNVRESYSPAHAIKALPGVSPVPSDPATVRYEGMVLGTR